VQLLDSITQLVLPHSRISRPPPHRASHIKNLHHHLNP
jgi:hypothetical protein